MLDKIIAAFIDSKLDRVPDEVIFYLYDVVRFVYKVISDEAAERGRNAEIYEATPESDRQ